MASMKVRVYVTLSVEPTEKHKDAMRFSASTRTDDKASVSVYTAPVDSKTLVAEFTVPKARQMDVVDRIVQAFEDFVPDSIDFSASFPPSEAETRKDPDYRGFICGKPTKQTLKQPMADFNG